MVTTLVFSIRNVAKQSVRGSGNHWYQTSRIRKFEDAIKVMARAQLGSGFKLYDNVPLWVEIIYRYKTKGDKEKYRIKTPDIDSNINKGLIDALKGIVWQDDKFISSMKVMKLDSLVDNITIKIGVLNEL